MTPRLFTSRGYNVLNFRLDQIAAAELAVDREIEVREVANPARKFEAGANGPHFLHFERRLLAVKPAGSDATTRLRRGPDRAGADLVLGC
jgi:hypothetical protein